MNLVNTPYVSIRTDDNNPRTMVVNVMLKLKGNCEISELRSSAFLSYNDDSSFKERCFKVQIPGFAGFSDTNYNKMY